MPAFLALCASPASKPLLCCVAVLPAQRMLWLAVAQYCCGQLPTVLPVAKVALRIMPLSRHGDRTRTEATTHHGKASMHNEGKLRSRRYEGTSVEYGQATTGLECCYKTWVILPSIHASRQLGEAWHALGLCPIEG